MAKSNAHHHEHSHAEAHGHCHNHNHSHEHQHGKLPVILYLVGLGLYLLALLSSGKYPIVKNTIFMLAMLISGYHVIFEGIGDTIQSTISKKKFMPNVHLLMALAAFGAAIIGDFNEGALLILIFAGAHFLEDYAEGRSRREITNLLKLNPTEARRILPDGTIELVDVAELKIGDRLRVLPGDQVATDGRIVEGMSSIDESSINGESIPREKTIGDEVFGSTVNSTGTFTMEVTKSSDETVFAKIIQLVNQSQNNLSQTATKIKRLEPIYVTIVLILVPVFILFGKGILQRDWYTSFYRGMVLMISASPCALAASAIPATLSGISNLAKRGVLFKGGSYLANLATIKVAAFDKTGTLTKGKPVVTDVYFKEEGSQVLWLDLIHAMEKQANHPLANAILEHIQPEMTYEVIVENRIGEGLMTTYAEKEYQIGKPSVFKQVTPEIQEKTAQLAAEGKTVVYFSENQQVVGLLALMDVPQEEVKEVIAYLKSQNIRTVMITGDAEMTGKAVAKILGMDQVVANVMPENKAQMIQSLQQEYGETTMLGDGINDAPALVQADIGFAMGDGADVAIDIADAVIMKNELKRFTYAHRVAKKLDKIVWQNIIFSMAIVVLLVTLNTLGKMDIALGVIAHEGSTLIVILNGLRLLIPVKE